MTQTDKQDDNEQGQCDVLVQGAPRCGLSAFYRYAAMGGGWMRLCPNHGERHQNICQTWNGAAWVGGPDEMGLPERESASADARWLKKTMQQRQMTAEDVARVAGYSASTVRQVAYGWGSGRARRRIRAALLAMESLSTPTGAPHDAR